MFQCCDIVDIRYSEMVLGGGYVVHFMVLERGYSLQVNL